MLKIKDYMDTINEIAPFDLAEPWDNVGLIVGSSEDTVSKVMLALDVTTKVIEEAVENKVNLIISHHPLMFSPIQKLSSNDLVYKLAVNKIGLISAHTNLDSVQGGVNDILGETLELENLEQLPDKIRGSYYTVSTTVPTTDADKIYEAIARAGGGKYGNYDSCSFMSSGVGRFRPLDGAEPAIGQIGKLEEVEETKIEALVVESNALFAVTDAIKEAHPYEEPSIAVAINYAIDEISSLGRIGELKVPMSCEGFAGFVKEKIGAISVKYTDNKKMIKTVVICGGSGSGYLDKAIQSGADAYLTGELKHENVLAASEAGLSTFEAGHFATEALVLEPLMDKLGEKLEISEIMLSKASTDGIAVV